MEYLIGFLSFPHSDNWSVERLHAAEVLGGVPGPLHRHGAHGREPLSGHQHGLGKSFSASYENPNKLRWLRI